MSTELHGLRPSQEPLHDDTGRNRIEGGSERPRTDSASLEAILKLACKSTNMSVGIWQLLHDEVWAHVAGTGLACCSSDEGQVRIGDGSWLSKIVESGEGGLFDGLQNDEWCASVAYRWSAPECTARICP